MNKRIVFYIKVVVLSGLFLVQILDELRRFVKYDMFNYLVNCWIFYNFMFIVYKEFYVVFVVVYSYYYVCRNNFYIKIGFF